MESPAMKYKCPKCEYNFVKFGDAEPICPMCGTNASTYRAKALAEADTEELEIDWDAYWEAYNYTTPSWIDHVPSTIPKRGRQGHPVLACREGIMTGTDGTQVSAIAAFGKIRDQWTLVLYLEGRAGVRSTWSDGEFASKPFTSALQRMGWDKELATVGLPITDEDIKQQIIDSLF